MASKTVEGVDEKRKSRFCGIAHMEGEAVEGITHRPVLILMGDQKRLGTCQEG